MSTLGGNGRALDDARHAHGPARDEPGCADGSGYDGGRYAVCRI